MSEARATFSNSKKSPSFLEVARSRATGPRKDRSLLERLEAENRELRNQAMHLVLQIQLLRHRGRFKDRSAAGGSGATSRRRKSRLS